MIDMMVNYMENMMENEKLYKQPLIGVWTTSAARYNLWTAIIKLDERVIYCDTDSIKGVFTDDTELAVKDAAPLFDRDDLTGGNVIAAH